MKRIIYGIIAVALLCGPVAADNMPGLQTGITAPDFTAATHTGDSITLSEVNKDGPVVLVFYRGGWCMFCNRQLQSLQQQLSEFDALNASIIAISVDLQENAAKSVEEKQLGFTVVSDPEAALLDLYGLVYQIPEDVAVTYVEYGIDLKGASGRDDNVVAIPATYVIDRNGTIAYAYANEDYQVRPDTNDILDVLKGLPQ